VSRRAQEGLAAFRPFKVQHGEQLYRAVRQVALAAELLVDEANGQRVDRELAADYHDREDPAGRAGERGGRWLRPAQRVGRCLEELAGYAQDDPLGVFLEGPGVGELTGLGLHGARDDLGQHDVTAEVDPGVAVPAVRERRLQVLLGEERALTGEQGRSHLAELVLDPVLHHLPWTWVHAPRARSP
jgi:hypothetical protein